MFDKQSSSDEHLTLDFVNEDMTDGPMDLTWNSYNGRCTSFDLKLKAGNSPKRLPQTYSTLNTTILPATAWRVAQTLKSTSTQARQLGHLSSYRAFGSKLKLTAHAGNGMMAYLPLRKSLELAE